MSQQTIANLDELRGLAERLVVGFRARQIVLLDGPMGIGKTQLIKFILEYLGSDEAVSPSFAILQEYLTEQTQVHHLDLYRLESQDDLESTGFWDLFDLPSAIILIEWSSKIDEFGMKDVWPAGWSVTHLELAMKDRVDGARTVTIKRLS